MGNKRNRSGFVLAFPISRDPPEGGTVYRDVADYPTDMRFQFLGIPPKGEPLRRPGDAAVRVRSFQFLGIPPKGERSTGARGTG